MKNAPWMGETTAENPPMPQTWFSGTPTKTTSTSITPTT